MGGVRAAVDVQIRFGDFDVAGNVDNTTLVGYLNEARNELLRSLPVDDWLRFAVRRLDVEFLGAVGLGVAFVQVEAELEEAGTTSLRTRERISAGGRAVVSATAVLVHVDEARTGAVPLPDAVRALVS